MILCALLLDGASIQLKTDAVVTGTSIELGEVAIIQGVEPDLLASIESIDLGYSPSPGYSRLLLGERVAQNIALAQPGFEFTLLGAPSCRVEPKTSTVPGSRLVEVARNAIETAARDVRATISLMQAVSDVNVPEGSSPPVVRASLNSMDVQTGTQSVTVRVEVDGHAHVTRQVLFGVQVWQTVTVLREGIESGDIITPAMLEQREVLVPGAQAGAPLTQSMLVGAVASRRLQEGRPILDIDVHRPLAVEAQSPIVLEVRSGAIKARATATALQGGSLGERIRVRLDGSEREMFAVIESRSLVVVDLGSR